MSGINTHIWLQRKRYSVSLALIALVSIVQLLSPLTANAIQIGGGGGGSLGGASSLSLDDQIMSYKMVYALSLCMTHATFISDSDVTSQNWFPPNQNEDTGSLAAQSYDDGKDVVNCNKTIQHAASMWGITDNATFLKSAGWTAKTSTVGPPCPNPNYCSNPGGNTPISGMQPPKNNADTLFQAALGDVFSNYNFPYESYYSYEDAFTTYTGTCGATYVSAGPLTGDDKIKGDVLLQVPDTSVGKVVTQVFSGSSKSVHFGAALGLVGTFGSAVNPSGYQYNSKTVSCSDIASYLAKPANAQNFIKTLPASLASSVNPAEKKGGEQGSSDNGSSCNIQGIGWIICPVMTFMGKVVDATYNVVSSLLTVPAVDTSPTSPLYKAWSTMRNISNVAFVIAFLFVIYSQITGAGVSNYGIKKLLPRIIAAAILVNVSYWLCAIAVDVSNVIGASVKGLFDTIIAGSQQPKSSWWDSSGTVGVVWTLGIATVIGASIAAFSTLAILLPMLVAAIFAGLTVLLILAARQAIIILCIVLSPLAFVAFLLPNTQKLYKRWQSTFVAMLVMFPAIAALFGASKLASVIVMNSSSNTIVQIMGAGISIVPLILSPIIMKMSTGVLGQVAGYINKATSKGSTAAQKPLKKLADDRAKYNKQVRQGLRLQGKSALGVRAERMKGSSNRFVRGAGGIVGGAAWATQPGAKVSQKLTQRGADRRAQMAEAEEGLHDAERNYVANRAWDSATKQANTEYTEKVAGATGNAGRVAAKAIQAQHKAFDEEVGYFSATKSGVNNDELRKQMFEAGRSEEDRAAAASVLAKNAGMGDMIKGFDELNRAMATAQANNDTAEVSRLASIQKQFMADGAQKLPMSVRGPSKGKLGTGTAAGSFEEEVMKSLEENGKSRYSGQILATMHPSELAEVAKILTANRATMNPAQLAQLSALKKSIAEYKASATSLGKGLATESEKPISEIESL